MSRRAEARRRREAKILPTATAILTDREFHQTWLEDVDSAIGISGLTLYRCFSSREELLVQILIDISIQPVDDTQAVPDRAKGSDWAPKETLRGLLTHHVHSIVTEPDHVRVQERGEGNSAPEQDAKVHSLQHFYMAL